MIVYVDASVVLRIVLDQPDALSDWPTVRSVSCALVRTESLRALDRLRLRDAVAGRALDEAGYLDSKRMRLTMAGLAAASAPRMVATERRRAPRATKSGARRGPNWAGAVAEQKPGLRKTAVVA